MYNIVALLFKAFLLVCVVLLFFGLYKWFQYAIYILSHLKLFKYFFSFSSKIKGIIQILCIILLLTAFSGEIWALSTGKIHLGGCSDGPMEFRSALKKSVSAINQAITYNYALENKVNTGSLEEFATMFAKRMSIIDVRYLEVPPFKVKRWKHYDDPHTFTYETVEYPYKEYSEKEIRDYNLSEYKDKPIIQTADGILYMFKNFTSGCKFVDTENPENSDCIMVVDVNGLKKPNEMTIQSVKPKDRYEVVIFGNENKATVLNKEQQKVMFDKPLQ